ncbi:NADPH-dependent oxidoreductase [Aetokthonos hydrillicola Thurmond2011]|jgi:nitroreductase|uniref:NADPH-dependent oxidoreductase n=1 Tax=Aetokthonos hydrillicola Thurmond2011 TaxID=2712845 RepID=A0AAP5IBN0_9CYAN|nr:NADPH-dependent oxidoreductase [Aetokthonos hydrillicola]MBW4585478.1 NADPH-dependent oxidoreductase [Aetokthonos hydrillicola CCALA 1050]MDR9896100.1 NADPH-dependent oxidoreductase [Aetokthonos hydrillicola Thurmond2011]
MTNPTDLLSQRYGTGAVDTYNRWNDSLTTLLSHRSIRAYLPDPLPPGTLEILVAAAQSAATSSNLQTWSLVAVEDPERKEKLSELASNQAHIRQCPLFLVWLADLARLALAAESRGLPHEGLDYLEMFLMATIDAALAAQNATVAAESLGLGTVYIGAMRNKPEEVAKVLNLPPQVFGVFGLCVGYADPAKEAAIKPRLSQSAILHRETYQLAEQSEAIAHYDEVMKAFYAEQQMNITGDWSEHSAKRVAFAQSLSGRDRLSEALKNLGFQLR